MFYEMWFPFPTNMERIYVISNLRQKEIILDNNVNQQDYANQVIFLKNNLNIRSLPF